MKLVILLSTVLFAVLTFLINREKLTNKYRMIMIKNKGLSKYVNETLDKISNLCERYDSCDKYLRGTNVTVVKKKVETVRPLKTYKNISKIKKPKLLPVKNTLQLNKQKWKRCKKIGKYDDQLYDQLLKISDAMREVNLKYVIAYGTLIGAARNNDINVNEVDNDIQVDKNQWKSRRPMLEKALLKRGLFMFDYDIPRICHLNDAVVPTQTAPWNSKYFPYTDVYTHTTLGKEYIDRKFGNHAYYKPWNIVQLRIRNKTFPVPNYYKIMLEKRYGKDWKDPNGSKKNMNYDGTRSNKIKY